ncbi:MAG: RIO1 family regulatory kinase/ATPase [Hyphomicrobiales bacterium]
MPLLIEDLEPAVQEFLDEGVITELLQVIKSGKEAVAFLCRAHPSLGAPYVVAKVYHERKHRNFARSTAYQDGRVILNGQVRRAVEKKTELGRDMEGAMWVDHEFETLSALHYAGADVPEPFFATERVILMAYIGDPDSPAPQLQHARLDPADAPQLFERLLWNVELFLANNIVHGDLSAFNVLVHGRVPVVIDFPQAVDPRFNAHARTLLERDVANIGKYFARYGIEFDPGRHAASLWRRWRFGELG